MVGHYRRLRTAGAGISMRDLEAMIGFALANAERRLSAVVETEDADAAYEHFVAKLSDAEKLALGQQEIPPSNPEARSGTTSAQRSSDMS